MAASRGAWNKREAESPIDHVQIDGLVVLKIIKHCQEEGAGVMDVAQGVLLGLVVDKRLEITNCFPFPRHTDEEDFDEVEYQMEMMRQVRQLNMDHLHVGWYQSTHYGNFFNRPLLESQYSYQSSIEESVVLIYDPVRTVRGFLTLKAYRLTAAAMDLYKEGEFGPDSMKSHGISYQKVFEEIPVFVRNSHLINGLLLEIADSIPQEMGMQFLDLSTASVLEKNLQSTMDCIDTITQEANKLTNYQRQVWKQQQAKNQYQQKRSQENDARQQRGEPALPEEDINKIFKPIPVPPRLDSLLTGGQINNYTTQLGQFASQNIGKLFMVEALQNP